MRAAGSAGLREGPWGGWAMWINRPVVRGNRDLGESVHFVRLIRGRRGVAGGLGVGGGLIGGRLGPRAPLPEGYSEGRLHGQAGLEHDGARGSNGVAGDRSRVRSGRGSKFSARARQRLAAGLARALGRGSLRLAALCRGCGACPPIASRRSRPRTSLPPLLSRHSQGWLPIVR